MISIVIPAYNEEKSIRPVVLSIDKVMKGRDYEIIVVDDGSTDATAKNVPPAARLVRHPYNKGYGASLKTGALEARGSHVLYIDADGQHNPKDILRLLEYSDFDMVVGQRKKQASLIRAPAKIMIGMVANYLAERKIPDINSGFRLIRKDVIMRFIDILPNTFSFTTTITLACFRKGYNVKYVPISIKKRQKGKSTMHPIKDTLRFIVLIVRMTMLFSPLRVFLPLSFAMMAVGVLLLGYEIFSSLDAGSVSVMFITSAILVFCFGLVADQISQIRTK